MRIFRDGSSLIVRVPAKLNLSLNILGRRDDGFHDLESLMVSIRLCDTITFTPLQDSGIQLTVSSCLSDQSPLPTDERNLIVKAARLLQEVTKTSQGVKIHLEKRIPSEAGLGGGSSDAAATLVSLNRLWNLNLPDEQLHEMAASLGSDLNFFLDSYPAALCTGRGECVQPLDLARPLYFVVTKPDSGLSTADVFRHWSTHFEPLGTKRNAVVEAVRSGEFRHLSGTIWNSLEASACELNEDIDSALRILSQQGVINSGMTGSGSACFGLCRSLRQAGRLARKINTLGRMKSWAVTSGV